MFSRLLLLAALVCCLTNCTRVDLAYRHLDVIVPWTLSDYLDMNREQKNWFNDQLKEQLRWHCSTQLPANLVWLKKVQQMVADNQVTHERVLARTNEAKAAIADVARQITPPAVQLLQGLDDNQVRAMQQALSEDLQKRREEFVLPPLSTQTNDRAKRMRKRLEPWFGTLSDSQQQRIAEWSRALGEQNREWLDNREHWQGLFMQAVNHRHEAEFGSRMAQLLQQRESLWTPQYQAAFARTETAGLELLVGLMADSTMAQRQHIEQKLAELEQDFSELKCLNPSR